MSKKPENEPFIAPSADDKAKNIQKGKADRGLVMIIAAYALGAFLIYLTILLVGTNRSMS